MMRGADSDKSKQRASHCASWPLALKGPHVCQCCELCGGGLIELFTVEETKLVTSAHGPFSRSRSCKNTVSYWKKCGPGVQAPRRKQGFQTQTARFLGGTISEKAMQFHERRLSHFFCKLLIYKDDKSPPLGTTKINDLAAVSVYRFREIPKLSKRSAFRAIAFVRATSHTHADSSEEPNTMRRPSGLNGKSRQDTNLFEELLGLRDA